MNFSINKTMDGLGPFFSCCKANNTAAVACTNDRRDASKRPCVSSSFEFFEVVGVSMLGSLNLWLLAHSYDSLQKTCSRFATAYGKEMHIQPLLVRTPKTPRILLPWSISHFAILVLPDGANVAYYGHSNVHYSSLKIVVEELLKIGEKPLVVMPMKYTQASFHVSGPYAQFLSKKDIAVIEW